MINLFEKLNENTNRLCETMNIKRTIVLEDDGFLPMTMESPYQFFAASYHTGHPKFFNQIDVPEFWEIEGTKRYAIIMDKKQKKGKIIYRVDDAERIVSSIEWYDMNMRIRVVDHYARNGMKFAETIFNKYDKPILKRYLDNEGREVIVKNLVTNTIILIWEGKQYQFLQYADFILFYIKQLKLENEQFVINSLGPALVAVNKVKSRKPHIVVWQEEVKNQLPGNMAALLSSDRYVLLVPDKDEYNKIRQLSVAENHKRIIRLGYVYHYEKVPEGNKEIFILTNSDRLRNIESLIKGLPKYTFNIVAKTDVSPTLSSLEKYCNVNVIAKADSQTIQQFFSSCDIYFDINEGMEVDRVLTKAYLHQLVIFAFHETVHNKKYVAKEHLFDNEEVQALIDILTRGNRQHMLMKQHETANAISYEEAHHTLENL